VLGHFGNGMEEEAIQYLTDQQILKDVFLRNRGKTITEKAGRKIRDQDFLLQRVGNTENSDYDRRMAWDVMTYEAQTSVQENGQRPPCSLIGHEEADIKVRPQFGHNLFTGQGAKPAEISRTARYSATVEYRCPWCDKHFSRHESLTLTKGDKIDDKGYRVW
jgi:hypothetical protein